MTIEQMNIDQEPSPPPRGRAAAMSQRGVTREGSRGPVRETNRDTTRQSVVVVGRDGKPLSRTRHSGADPYELPSDLVDPGWSYQWIPLTVYGDSTIVQGQHRNMHNNGWRPVMAVGRWQGRMMPADYTGPIIYETLGLYERPQELTDEALAEEKVKADSQMRDRDQSLMGGKANLAQNVPAGFEMRSARAKVTVGPEAAPRPSYQPADDSV